MKYKFTYIIVLALICLSIFSYGNDNNLSKENKLRLERINKLHSESKKNIKFHDSSAITKSKEALQLAHLIGDNNIIMKSSNHLFNVYYLNSDYDNCEKVLTPLSEFDLSTVTDDNVAWYYSNLGHLHNIKANYRLSEFYILKSIELFEKIGDKQNIANNYQNLGINYRFKGEYNESANHLYKALKLFEEINDSLNIYTTREEIALLFYYQDDCSKAIDVLDESVEYYTRTKDSLNLGYIYSYYSVISNKLGNYEQGIDYALKSYEIRKAIGDIAGQAESLNNLSTAYASIEDWNKAITNYEEALRLRIISKEVRYIAAITANIGLVKYKLGEYNEAIEYINKGIELAKESGENDALLKLYKSLYEINAKEGNYKDAYNGISEFVVLNDSIFSNEKSRIINELQIKYDIKKHEKEFEIIEKEKELSKQKNTALIIGLFLISVIATLIIILQRVKNKKKKSILEAELEITNNKLEFKKNRLLLHTDSIIKKNELIEDLLSQIEEISGDSNNLKSEKTRLIGDLLESKILTDKNWEDFKKDFDQVYEYFFATLKTSFPDLTAGEQRLFALLKLNLSSKEVSNVLGISIESVKKNRYRLKKKLDLNPEENLDKFVNSFS